MAILKCKMCGGDVELSQDKTFGTCDHCGSTMTFPKIDDEQRAAAFNRGNHFRRIGEFDKALTVYERIVQEDENDAEAHWCCALCRFGIEYVEDPATFEWLPTCHRASFDSFLEDVDYLAAVEHSEGLTRRQYQKDAAKIAEVQRGILATSQNAEPYDVFICYKESDEKGQRTVDSTLAQDIYYQLTEQGRKVFFARITLEDVAGAQYEPYIFAALNSAKVMIVVGTKPEYLNAVWVKNEWSRFLAMMKKDHHKLLLPCYRGMDPYDLPEQLSVLQSYDMAKIGFIQDLIRGVAKVLDADKKPEVVKETVVVNNAAPANATAPLLKRAFMFLEDGDFARADEFCEQVLNLEPECAQAYLGKLMAEMKVTQQEALKDCAQPFHTSVNFQKAVRFGDDGLKLAMKEYIDHIVARNKAAELARKYKEATTAMSTSKSEANYKRAAAMFNSISDYQDSAELANKCLENAEVARKDAIIDEAAELVKRNTIDANEMAIRRLEPIADWKWAGKMIEQCHTNIQTLKEIEEEKRLAAKRLAKRRKRITAIALASVSVVIILVLLWVGVISPEIEYNKAISLMENGNYQEAIEAFRTMEDYKESKSNILACFDQLFTKVSIDAGYSHTVALNADGTVVATGSNTTNQCNVYRWTDIVSVGAGYGHTVGLKSDGTVVAVGSDQYNQCFVSDWTDIVAISAGGYHTVGLKYDGTVVAVGQKDNGQCNVSKWDNIIAISSGSQHTVGLKANGTVVAVGYNLFGQCNISDWSDIVAIEAGENYTAGLKKDGTVVIAGYNFENQNRADTWKNIVALGSGGYQIVGLKADGTVVAVGNNYNGECLVNSWKDVVAISAGYAHTVGLKADGTVVAVGYKIDGRCDVSDWKNIKVPEKK